AHVDRRAARSNRIPRVTSLGRRWPVPAAVGVRHARSGGRRHRAVPARRAVRGKGAVPVRSAVRATALTVATLVAAVVYVTSANPLLDPRRLYGWSHDVQVGSAGLPSIADAVVAGLDQRDDVVAISSGTVAELQVA